MLPPGPRYSVCHTCHAFKAVIGRAGASAARWLLRQLHKGLQDTAAPQAVPAPPAALPLTCTHSCWLFVSLVVVPPLSCRGMWQEASPCPRSPLPPPHTHSQSGCAPKRGSKV